MTYSGLAGLIRGSGEMVQPILDLKRYLILLLVSLLFGCGTFSTYKESDCELSPEQYGQCSADLGYQPAFFESMAKYCEDRGKKIDLDKFRVSRLQRLSALCAQTHEIFTLEFRSAIGLNGPETCPDIFLTTEDLRKAAKDGRSAGIAYQTSKEYIAESKRAEERREKSDKEGFWAGLWDRVFKSSADEYKQSSISSSEKSEQLRRLYPNATRLTTQGSTCSPNGYF